MAARLRADLGMGVKEKRLSLIKARWPLAGWDHRGQNRWEAWGFSFYATAIGSGALAAGAYLDIAFWTRRPIAPFLPFEITPGRGLSLTFCALFGGWCLDRFLALKTQETLRVPYGFRCLRLALAVVPIVGLMVVPTWRYLLEKRPGWAFPKRLLGPLDLADPSPETRRHAAKLLTSWCRGVRESIGSLILWLIFCQIFPFLAVISRLGAIGGRPGLLAAWGAVHFLAGACAGWQVWILSRRRRIAGGRRALLWIGAASLTLPFPFWVPAAVFALYQSVEKVEQKTLVWAVYKLLRDRDKRPQWTSAF